MAQVKNSLYSLCICTHGVGILTTRMALMNKKHYELGQFVFLRFLNEPAADRHTLLAPHVSPTECLSKVRYSTISRIALPLFLGGLLGKDEASQLALHLRLTHQQ